MLICNVVGARPNFVKAAPVIAALQSRGVPQCLVHTGQHFDARMSGLFFEELGLPQPDVCLGIDAAAPAVQTGQILIALERVLNERSPTLVVVYGDVTSTLAAGLAACKCGIRVAHVEAGLRSFDPAMPEELNRVLTDHLSQLLFTTEESGRRNLRREGIAAGMIHFVGNCMVDALLGHLPEALARKPWAKAGFQPGDYAVLTLHRPANVDAPDNLRKTLLSIRDVAQKIPVLFPVHPRTLARLTEHHVQLPANVLAREPLSYVEFLGLMARARFVMTDSGGIQEETTVLQVPCLTLRANTERPVTLELGTNRLVDTDQGALLRAVNQVLAGMWPKGRVPPLWDGRAGERIATVIEKSLMSSADETQRITDVYRQYHQGSPLAKKWSGSNPGNRWIAQERDHARLALLARWGYVPLAERRILEIGCGAGEILAGMLAAGARPENLVGLDLVAERIEEAQRRFPDLRFVQGNAAALDFPDASFDLVLLYTVFSSMLDARMQAAAARETVRVLRPGGAVVWYDFRYSNPRTLYARGLRRYQIRALFPDLERHLRSITLLPPLARRLGSLTGLLYPCLAALPPLRTHWLGLLIKPGGR